MADKAITKYAETAEFPALLGDGEEVAAILQENLGGERLTPFSLERIKVPSGGDKFWRVPDLEKGQRAEEQVLGIILHNQYARAYFDTAYGADDPKPPSCTSYEMGGMGYGDPGGECASCPFNQFGSALDQNGAPTGGKACQEKRFLFILSPGDYLPSVIQGPATSLRSIRDYGLELGRKGLRMGQVVTAFVLESEKRGGYPTSVIKPKFAGLLSPEDCQKVAALQDQLKPMFQQSARNFAQDEAFLND